MSHIPINHPMRTLYRVLAALAGIYVLAFGVVALSRTSGEPLFTQDHLRWALGLRANMAFALISVAAGVVILGCAVIGRNIDHFINTVGGVFFMAMGMAMMILLRTNANFLGFSMANCIASFVIGLVLFAAGLYGKTGSAAEAHAEELSRHHH
jgi:hypothetical protein